MLPYVARDNRILFPAGNLGYAAGRPSGGVWLQQFVHEMDVIDKDIGRRREPRSSGW